MDAERLDEELADVREATEMAEASLEAARARLDAKKVRRSRAPYRSFYFPTDPVKLPTNPPASSPHPQFPNSLRPIFLFPTSSLSPALSPPPVLITL